MSRRFTTILILALSVVSPLSQAKAFEWEEKTLLLTSLSPGCRAFEVSEQDDELISLHIDRKKQLKKRRRCKLNFRVIPGNRTTSLLVCREYDIYLHNIIGGEGEGEMPVAGKTRLLSSDSCGDFSYTVRTRKRTARRKTLHFALDRVEYARPVTEGEDGKVCSEVLTCGLNIHTGEVSLYSNSCGIDQESVFSLEPEFCDVDGIQFIVVE